MGGAGDFDMEGTGGMRCWLQVLLGHPGGSCVATRGLCKQATWWDSPGISLGDPFTLPTFIFMVVDKEKTMVYQK